MAKTDEHGRRLVSFYVGGRVKKKADPDCFKKGGKVQKKARGGALSMAPEMSMAGPANPMEGRMTTGAVARPPRAGVRKRMPTVGAPMVGALGRV